MVPKGSGCEAEYADERDGLGSVMVVESLNCEVVLGIVADVGDLDYSDDTFQSPP